MDYFSTGKVKAWKFFVTMFSVLFMGIGLLVPLIAYGNPNDVFAEHGKHLPWSAEGVFALTSGYNQDYHVSPNTKYLLDFAKRFDNGTPDQAGTNGQSVRSIGDGTVIEVVSSGYNDGLGRYVKVDHGNGYVTRYDHLGSVTVNTGDVLMRGAEIGKIGDTGFSIGYHLQVSLWHDGTIVPLEEYLADNRPVQGVNLTTFESPITSFFGKTNDFFLSFNYDGLPANPLLISATPLDCNSVNLAWEDVEKEQTYSIVRDGVDVAFLSNNTVTYTDTGLSSGSHVYQIRANNNIGSSISNSIETVMSVCDGSIPVPMPPTLTGAVDVDCKSVLLDWTDVTDENTYSIFRNNSLLASVPADVISFTDESVYEENDYTYFVRANNEGGSSPDSNSLLVTVAKCSSVGGMEPPVSPELGGPQLDEINYGDNTLAGLMDDPVDSVNGNFYTRHTDMKVESPGIPVEISRAYNSNDSRVYSMGKGWRFSYDIQLINTADDQFAVKLADGSADYFQFDGTGFTPVFKRTIATLEASGETFTYTLPNGTKYSFDMNGKLMTISDRNNNTMTFTYDADAFLDSFTDTAGRNYDVTFQDGRIISVTDSIGRSVTYAYDDEDKTLTSATTPAGNEWKYAYNDSLKIVSETDPRGNTQTLAYDNNEEKVISVKHADGGITSFDYQSGKTVQTDELGGTIEYIHDGEGHLVEMKDQAGKSEFYGYDALDQISSYKDRNGRETRYEYDQSGNLTKITKPNGYVKAITYGNFANPTGITDPTGAIQMQYDTHGNMTQYTDQLGNTTGYSYDTRGLVTASTNPANQNISISYDSNGNMTGLTNPKGDTTEFTYDGVSRRTKVTDALNGYVDFGYNADSLTTTVKDARGGNVTYSYDNFGNITQIKNEAGDASNMTYTALNQLETRTDFEGNQWEYIYDLDQNLIKEIDPRGFATEHEYDSAGRRVKTILPEEGVITYAYDANDNLLSTSDPNNNNTSFEYTSTNALKKVTNALGDSMVFERDELDRVTKITDWKGNVQEFSYDGLSRIASEKTKMNGTVSYTYDPVSNLIEVVDPLGRSTKYAYDNANQMIEVTDAENGKTTLTYDAVGNVIAGTDQNGHTTTYNYDSSNNIISITDPEGGTTQYTYDLRNILDSVTDPNGNVSKFSYNKNGLLVSRVNPKNDSFDYQYDAASNLVKTFDEIGATHVYTYDGQNRLTSHISALGNTESFSYDNASNLTTHTDARGNSTSYAYDALNRLVKEIDALGGATQIIYDANSNRTSVQDELARITGFTYNPLDQITGITNAKNDIASLTYNEVGDLIERTDFRGNSYSYGYDKLSRLVKLTNARGFNTNFSYDPASNLVSTTNANNYSTSYVYDKANRMVEVQRPEAVIEKFIYDPASNLIKAIDGEGGTNLNTYDANNQLVEATSPLGFKTTYTYTPTLLEATITDANGHQTLYSYDVDRNLKKITDPRGNNIEYSYDANSNLIQQTDKRGFNNVYVYDPLNRLTKFTDEAGFDEIYSYDAVDNLVTQENRRGFSTNFSYDALNQLSALTDAKNETELYSYDADGNLVKRVDRAGNQTGYSYDEMSNLVEILDALNGKQQFGYDPIDQKISELNQNAQENRFQFDGLGRLTKQIDALNGETSFTYNNRSEATSLKNPRGFTTLFEYDANGRMTKRTDPTGFSELFAYDPVDNILEYKDRRGNATRYTYNPNDQLETEIDAMQYQREYSYDENGNKIKFNDGRGNDWLWNYEPRNNVEKEIQPQGQITAYSYDPNENLVKQTLPLGNENLYVYDPLDLVEQMKDPMGHTTKFGYDAVERKISMTDAKNQTTGYDYDPLYRLTAVRDAMNGETKYSYDPVGNMLTTTDANQHTTGFAYDALNRVVAEVNPLSKKWQYSYDANSNLTQRVDANGKATEYVYDPNDRLTNKKYPDSAENIGFEYDPNGNMTDMKDKSGKSAFVYDPLNRVTEQTDAKNYQLGYTYDGNHNRTEIRYPNGKVLSSQYSPNNWLVSQTDWQNLKTTFSYDDNKNLIEEIYPNNSKVNYTYDPDDKLTKKVNHARDEDFETFTYEYDPVHNIVGETHDYSKSRERGPVEPEHNEISYSYDPLSRLTEVTDITGKQASYEYDAVGNRLKEINNRNFELIKNGKGTFDGNEPQTIDYRYNEANQLTGDTYFDYQYDANGNRTRKDKKNDSEVFNYQYDFENRMNRVEYSKNPPAPIVSEYLFDGLNRRVQTVAGGSHSNGQGTGGAPVPKASTWYTYDQFSSNPLVEFPDPNKEIQYRRAEDRLLSMETFSGNLSALKPGNSGDNKKDDGNGVVKGNENSTPVEQGRYAYFYSNNRGDTTSILKHDGQSLHSYMYDEYGMQYDVNAHPTDSSNFTDPHAHYTFSAKQFDAETELSYFGARSYDAWNGTWTAQDLYRGQIDLPETLHRYQFNKNNALRYTDPNGYNSIENEGAGVLGYLLAGATNKDVQNFAIGMYNSTQSYVDQPPVQPTVTPLPAYQQNTCALTNCDGGIQLSGQTSGSGVIPYTNIPYNYGATGAICIKDGTAIVNACGDVGVNYEGNNYAASGRADAALGYNNSQGLVSAIGVSGAVAKNNEVIYEGTWIAANNAGLNALGVNSAAEYKQKVQEERRQNLVISMNKLKTERIMRQRELARQEELARSGGQMQGDLKGELQRLQTELEGKGFFYKLSDQGQLEQGIIVERALASGIDLDSDRFDSAVRMRDLTLSMYEHPFRAVIDYILLGGPEGVASDTASRQETADFYRNISSYEGQLTDADYTSLAQNLLNIEKSNIEELPMIMGGGIKNVGGVGKAGLQAIESGNYTITKTVAGKVTERPYINSPSTITNIMQSGEGVPDAFYKGGMNWKVPGSFNGTNGIFELGINPETNTIYHFLFKSIK